MLEAKQKAAAESEEQRRQQHQSALAKYRQAFASDTEVQPVSVICPRCAYESLLQMVMLPMHFTSLPLLWHNAEVVFETAL